MRYKTGHLSEELIARLDRELGRAIADVDGGAASKAAVSLTFSVERDEDEMVVVKFQHKAGAVAKGTFRPAVQARLPLDDEEPREADLLEALRR